MSGSGSQPTCACWLVDAVELALRLSIFAAIIAFSRRIAHGSAWLRSSCEDAINPVGS
jgi:hypothetical protein